MEHVPIGQNYRGAGQIRGVLQLNTLNLFRQIGFKITAFDIPEIIVALLYFF